MYPKHLTLGSMTFTGVFNLELGVRLHAQTSGRHRRELALEIGY
jgi:hypothetical protein